MKLQTSRKIGGKIAVWVGATNRYILVDPPAAEIVRMLAGGAGTESIVAYCRQILGLSPEQAVRTDRDMRKMVLAPGPSGTISDPAVLSAMLACARALHSSRVYRIYGRTFRFDFATERTERMLHPKYAHLACDASVGPDHRFQLLEKDGYYALRVDGKAVGMWSAGEEHVCSGQCHLHLLSKAYRRRQSAWMGVLHAAAVARGDQCLIFVGDSGAGKSTLAALLAAYGYAVCADDFLPMEGKTGRVCHCPAAISVKQSAMDILAPSFPVLRHAQTHHYAQHAKRVRYLPVSGYADSPPAALASRGLVFVQYQPDAAFQFRPIPQAEAFVRLVPDTWIRPTRRNAQDFLKWFAGQSFYALRYSDPAPMLAVIANLFGSEYESS